MIDLLISDQDNLLLLLISIKKYDRISISDAVREDLTQVIILDWIEIIRYFLFVSIDVNERLCRFKDIITLILIYRHSHTDIMKLLIDFGARIETLRYELGMAIRR